MKLNPQLPFIRSEVRLTYQTTQIREYENSAHIYENSAQILFGQQFQLI